MVTPRRPASPRLVRSCCACNDPPGAYRRPMSTDEKQRTDASDAARHEEERDETKGTSSGDERRVVATVHANASPAKEDDDVRPIGNTDVPVSVNARDRDAP